MNSNKYKKKQIIWDIDNTIFPNNMCSSRKTSDCTGIKQFIKLTNWNDQYIFLTGRPCIFNLYTKIELMNKLNLPDNKIKIYNCDFISSFHDGFLSTPDYVINDKCKNYYQICQDYPDYEFIYIGDSGKVDPAVINKINVEGYLHKLHKNISDDCLSTQLFDNYIQLSHIFAKKGLIKL